MQLHLFPLAAGYLGRNYLSSASGASLVGAPNEIFGEFSSVLDSYFQGGKIWEQALSKWIKKLDFTTTPVQIISDETLSKWPSPLAPDSRQWPVNEPLGGDMPRRGHHPITMFLERLSDFLPKDVDLLTILTLRNQSDFLGSLSAQVHVRRGAIIRSIERRDAFLDFYSLVIDLEKVVGASNHLTLLFEDDLDHNFKKVVAFGGLSPLNSFSSFGPGKAENVRQKDGRAWEGNPQAFYAHFPPLPWLRSVFHRKIPKFLPAWRAANRLAQKVSPKRSFVVSISEVERAVIRYYCGPSNELLAQHLRRDLVSLGY
jgi:hypothetical protein